MPESSISLQCMMETQGYLSLAQLVEYLRAYHVEAAISYPTALKLVKAGKIRARRVGGVWRIGPAEVQRWVSEGNYDRMTFSPYPRDPLQYR